MADLLIISLILAYSGFVIARGARKKKSGCSGACESCHGCDPSYFDSLIKKAKEEKV